MTTIFQICFIFTFFDILWLTLLLFAGIALLKVKKHLLVRVESSSDELYYLYVKGQIIACGGSSSGSATKYNIKLNRLNQTLRSYLE